MIGICLNVLFAALSLSKPYFCFSSTAFHDINDALTTYGKQPSARNKPILEKLESIGNCSYLYHCENGIMNELVNIISNLSNDSILF